MSNDVKKEDLVKKAFELGLGTEEFLNKVGVENLKGLIAAVETREEGIIEVSKTNEGLTEQLEGLTEQVEDLEGTKEEILKELASRPKLSKEAAEKAKRMEKVTTVKDLVNKGRIGVVGDGK